MSVGEPWIDLDPRPTECDRIGLAVGIDPEKLWEHVEGEHGWESHDEGYAEAVLVAAECMLNGSPCKEERQ